MKILAFDIGIKNLAWSLIDKSSIPYKVLGLANENIMENNGTEEEDLKKRKCNHSGCRNNGGWQVPTSYYASNTIQIKDSVSILEYKYYCKRHIPDNFTTLEDTLNCDKVPKKITNTILRTLLRSDEKKQMRRDDIIKILEQRIAFPIDKPKQKRANSLGPEALHDAIRIFVIRHTDIFRLADRILIENQPAFKNPHMKTVQILLFSCLRELFYKLEGFTGPPPCLLVHAKKKVSDAPKGDAGYTERKAKSEERVKELYSEGQLSGFEELFFSSKKKSDMADALSMCCDFTLSE